MNQHVDNLREIANYDEIPGYVAARLEAAAQYIEAHEDLANECRRKVDVQISLRVEAQARAGRLAREARR